MKTTLSASVAASVAALALSICIGSPAMAQGNGHRDRGEQAQSDRQGQRGEQRRVFRNDDRQARRDDRRDNRWDRRDDRRDDRWDRRQHRRDDRFDRRDDRRHGVVQGRPFYAPHYSPNRAPPRVVYSAPHGWRGAGPNHNFYRGGRLPSSYRSHHYVVSNWHAHRLSAPPRGYHWVQTGPDYVLAAIATGVILQIMLGG